MVTINKHIEPIVELFDGNDNKIGDICNMTELADVQLQICTNNLDGYYIVFKNEKIAITNNGALAKWPNDLYDGLNKTMGKLYKARVAKK